MGGGVKTVIAKNIDLGIFCFGIILFGILIVLLNNVQMYKLGKTRVGAAATVGIATGFVIVPLLPHAVSARYQLAVNASDYISVPAVYYSYLAVVFLVSYLIWEIAAGLREKALIMLIVVITVFSMGIQMMNHVIEDRQKETANRMLTIEEAFKTDIVARLEGREVDAADLYETIDALGFENDVAEDGYWTLFARHHGHDITLKSRSDGSDASMFYKKETRGGLIGIRIDNLYYILAKERQSDPKAMPISDGQYVIASFAQYTMDHGRYIYSYIIVGDELMPMKGIDTSTSVGGTWQEAVKMTNIYEDGFIGADGDFIIRTGNAGKMTIKLYCPFEIVGDERYRIYVNGQEMVCARAESGDLEQVIMTALQDQLVVVHIETNFAQQPENGDERELSMLISDAYTE